MTRSVHTVPRNRIVLPAIDWTDLDWQERAACVGTDVNLWFQPNTDDDWGARETEDTRVRRERRAKGFCRDCPVKQQCLDWAFDVNGGRGDWFAILGGKTPYERRQMRRKRRKAAS